MTATALKSVPDTPDGTTIKLIAEDPPPARSGRTGVADKIVELVPSMVVGRWYKVATFSGEQHSDAAAETRHPRRRMGGTRDGLHLCVVRAQEVARA